MSPSERLARGQALFNWARECLATQIRAEHQASGVSEPLDAGVVKLLVWRQMYAAEPQVCEWIDRLVADLFR